MMIEESASSKNEDTPLQTMTMYPLIAFFFFSKKGLGTKQMDVDVIKTTRTSYNRHTFWMIQLSKTTVQCDDRVKINI